jgi:hypothetical protein
MPLIFIGATIKPPTPNSRGEEHKASLPPILGEKKIQSRTNMFYLVLFFTLKTLLNRWYEGLDVPFGSGIRISCREISH